MNDELQHIVTQSATGGSIGGIAGLARMIIFGHAAGPLAWIASTVAGVVVGVIAWLLLLDTKVWDFNPSIGMKVAAVIMAAMVARDILLGLAALGSEFSKNPIGLVRSFWDAIRGK